MQDDTIRLFAILNFVFAGLCAIAVLFAGLVLFYGIFFSGDKGDELAAGVLGTMCIGFFPLLGAVVYSLAGFGLLKQKPLGYYLHIAGAVLAIFTCLGIIYTVFALMAAFRPEFSAVFLKPASPVGPDYRD